MQDEIQKKGFFYENWHIFNIANTDNLSIRATQCVESSYLVQHLTQ